MSEFTYTVTVVTDTVDQAEQVMAERLGFDEDYGFPYFVEYEISSEHLVCPLCGGDTTDQIHGPGMLVCMGCSEVLYPHERVVVATDETRAAYYNQYPHSRESDHG